MSNFSDWEFLLNGNRQEFRQLASKEGSYYFNIYGGVDHWLDCPNDDFRMTSIYCEGEDDPSVIWQIGHELVSLFNGASILFSENYRKASIFKLAHNDAIVDFIPPSGNAALLGRAAGVDAGRLAEEYENGKRATIKFALLHLATENEDVYFILKYLDMPLDWVTLYKLLEAVETFAGSNSIDLKQSKSQRKSFTNTANNFSLSGFDSRHGFKDLTKKNNTSAMSISEGYEFVVNLSKKYLKAKYFS